MSLIQYNIVEIMFMRMAIVSRRLRRGKYGDLDEIHGHTRLYYRL